MNRIGKGYIQIYTGNGKGKTTASLGLALRAAGAGLKTHIVQFMKGQHYSELDAVKKLKGLIVIEQFGDKKFCKFTDQPDPKYVKQAKAGFERLKELMASKACDILIADEVLTAVMFHLVAEDELLDLMKTKPDGIELVLTGRGATDRLMIAADLVTEMKEIKHYYQSNVSARKGIES